MFPPFDAPSLTHDCKESLAGHPSFPQNSEPMVSHPLSVIQMISHRNQRSLDHPAALGLACPPTEKALEAGSKGGGDSGGGK